MQRYLIAIAVAVVPFISSAQETSPVSFELVDLNSWECFDRSDYHWWKAEDFSADTKPKVIVALLSGTVSKVDSEIGVGMIVVGEISYHTSFRIDGFNRRWEWEGHLFLINLDGGGFYVEFKGKESAFPSRFYQCDRQDLSRNEERFVHDTLLQNILDQINDTR